MTTAEAFREFVERAHQLRSLSKKSARPAENLIHRFREFAEAAYQCVIVDLEGSANDLRAAVRPLEPWIGDHDILALGGLTLVENSYTRFLAWALDPNTHASTALVRQQAWLACAGIDRRPTTAVEPTPFPRTSKGIPDLVLDYKDFVVVIEAKTITDEHATPDGQSQTHAYGPAVAEALKRPPESVETVYLTLDRSLPENVNACRASHLESLFAIIGSIRVGELPDDVQAGFRIIVTHFAANAGRPSRDLRRAIRLLAETNAPLAGFANLASDDLRDILTLRRLLGETT